MRDRLPCRVAFGAKLFVVLLAVAAIPAWTLGQSTDKETKKPEVNTSKADAELKAIEAQIAQLSEKLAMLRAKKAQEQSNKTTDESKKKALNIEVEALKKALLAEEGALKNVEGALKLAGQNIELKLGEAGQIKEAILNKIGVADNKNIRVLVAGKDGVKVIGADGKELKDVKVIVDQIKTVEGKPIVTPAPVKGVPAGHSMIIAHVATPDGAIALSRATYKLTKEQAAALSTLLGAIKTTVMETKVDGESIIVTTTPEAQATVSNIVKLIQGQSGVMKIDLHLAPEKPGAGTKPTKPAPPAAPTKPVPPAPPTKPGKVSLPAQIEQELLIELKDLDSLILEKLKDSLKKKVEDKVIEKKPGGSDK